MMNQKDQVLQHLRKKKSITSWEAIQKYGITRLADTVFQLKGKGYDIITTIEMGNGKKWAKYTYLGMK
jgi:hypothetical protein